jgi:two-component system response regulator PilR (NtrC family)
VSRKVRAQPKVLVIDDEPDLLELLELTLSRMGLDTERASNVAEAVAMLDRESFDLCLTDWRLPDGEGLRVVEHINQNGLDVPVAVITAHGSAENAVAALKAGAFDYLSKPVALEQLRALVKQALKVPDKPTGSAAVASQLLGESAAIEHVRGLIERLAKSQAPVFINGESGSGKELAAAMIHSGGPARAQPFVAVNCGAIPEQLMESEFFGYRKGAFTGAEADRDGFFQAANGGTLFLDEVADLPLAMQVKLLRAIQEKKVRKVGATAEEPVDVRIISATHKKLSALVDAGAFRQDLFYRLHVIELAMPPLREMQEDIPASRTRSSRGSRAARPRASRPTRWPRCSTTRSRQRARAREHPRARALARGRSAAHHRGRPAPDAVRVRGGRRVAARREVAAAGLLDRVERQAINEALEKTRFNRTAAAKLLGITFRAMRYRMERLGIK